VFQHDNAAIYEADAITDWFDEMGVQELDWPSQSPDFNPIELLWDELERRLRARPQRPKTTTQLFAILQEEWRAIPAAVYQHLEDSFPRRVEAAIRARGRPTDLKLAPHVSEMRGVRSLMAR